MFWLYMPPVTLPYRYDIVITDRLLAYDSRGFIDPNLSDIHRSPLTGCSRLIGYPSGFL